MVLMKALKPVLLNGRIIEAGSLFSCSPEFSKKLIDGNSAELAFIDQPKGTVEKDKQEDPGEVFLKKSLEAKTKDELLKYVSEKGIDGVNSSNTKAEIIEAIMKAADPNEI